MKKLPFQKTHMPGQWKIYIDEAKTVISAIKDLTNEVHINQF